MGGAVFFNSHSAAPIPDGLLWAILVLCGVLIAGALFVVVAAVRGGRRKAG